MLVTFFMKDAKLLGSMVAIFVFPTTNFKLCRLQCFRNSEGVGNSFPWASAWLGRVWNSRYAFCRGSSTRFFFRKNRNRSIYKFSVILFVFVTKNLCNFVIDHLNNVNRFSASTHKTMCLFLVPVFFSSYIQFRINIIKLLNYSH